jgi:hypothetical protein
MARTEVEQRTLRRELLLARAAVERAALADRLDELERRSRSGLPGALLRGASSARRSGLLGVAASGIRLARSQPWLVPAVVGGAVRLSRSRTLRWVAVAAVVATAVWWVRRQSGSAASTDEPQGDGELPTVSDEQ